MLAATLGEAGDRIVATLVALAAFVTALAILFRYPPLKWIAHAIRDSLIDAHEQATTRAVTSLLANGNPLSKQIREATGQAIAETQANRQAVGDLSEAVSAHIARDEERFDRIDGALGLPPADPPGPPSRLRP